MNPASSTRTGRADNFARHRHALPQIGEGLWLTDGGMETTLIFHEGIDLPCFAAFDLLRDAAGQSQLRQYYERYVGLARLQRTGIILESPTWRANRDWGARLGYDANALRAANGLAIDLLVSWRDEWETPESPMVISGNLGPRGDGYRPDARMDIAESRDYHAVQISTFADTAADMVAAFTMNYFEEAAGIALAARDHGMPLAISFTVETDGRLASGTTLQEAIERTDETADGHPSYYMVNCAHPTHFEAVLAGNGSWRSRIRGIRANASRCSHAELDEATELDAGNPDELGAQYQRLRELLPALAVVGGCCGTDHRHVAAISQALLGQPVTGLQLA